MKDHLFWLTIVAMLCGTYATVEGIKHASARKKRQNDKDSTASKE